MQIDETDDVLLPSSKSGSSWRNVIIKTILIVASIAGFAALIAVTAIALVRRNGYPTTPSHTTNSKCLPPPYYSSAMFDVAYNSRKAVQQRPQLLKNFRMITDGRVVDMQSLLIVDGKIASINNEGTLRPDTITFDLQGRFITPGLIDAHSHLGVHSFPDGLWGHSDTNENANPTTPFVRAVDSINPKDPAITQMLNAGVTSAMVLVGSSNVIGGQGALVKTKRGFSVSDMLIKDAPIPIKVSKQG
jgi:hypothetical protein